VAGALGGTPDAAAAGTSIPQRARRSVRTSCSDRSPRIHIFGAGQTLTRVGEKSTLSSSARRGSRARSQTLRCTRPWARVRGRVSGSPWPAGTTARASSRTARARSGRRGARAPPAPPSSCAGGPCPRRAGGLAPPAAPRSSAPGAPGPAGRWACAAPSWSRRLQGRLAREDHLGRPFQQALRPRLLEEGHAVAVGKTVMDEQELVRRLRQRFQAAWVEGAMSTR
jgi:hypothetical protein